MPTLEERVKMLENEQLVSTRMKSFLSGFAVLLVTGVITCCVMLLSTNQTSTLNAESIRELDQRQRQMQTGLARVESTVERVERILIHREE